MITSRHALACMATALAIFGMSHATSAFYSSEREHHGSHNEGSENEGSENENSGNEGSENEGSENEGSENEGSEHSGSQDEASKHFSSVSTRSGMSVNSSSGSGNTAVTGSSSNTSGTRSLSKNESLVRKTSRTDSTTRAATPNNSQTRPAIHSTDTRSTAVSRKSRERGEGTERKTTLRTFVGGHGSAEYKVSGNDRSFEVELENTTLAPGTLLTVRVNGISAGQMTAIRKGRKSNAKLKLETRLGHSVPTIATGSAITIEYGTATVASGTIN